ncbi:MAG TPA: hypothetical protein PLU37_09595 [Chitinophagaceae bacterium]|nr:hypothetical protein [Chitinophagaceae bacterium]
MSQYITLRFTNALFRKFSLLAIFSLWTVIVCGQAIANIDQTNTVQTSSTKKKSASERLEETLKCFNPLNKNAEYSITLCADIPDNNQPDRVHVRSETGHVFIVLTKIQQSDTTHCVFGFYPRRPASSLIFKNVRSEILDNSEREYNISVFKQLDETSFMKTLNTAIELAKKKYNLNKYNCYDYAIDIFNEVAGTNKLPKNHINFSFIFGKGGSSCSLYADLKQLKENGSTWAPYIQIGLFKAPVSKDFEISDNQ